MRLFLAVVALMFSGWLLMACGGSAIEAQMHAAQVTRTALDASKYIIEDRVRDEVKKAASNPKVDTHEAEIDMHNAVRKYDPLMNALSAAVDAFGVWSVSLASAYEGDEKPDAAHIWWTLAMNAFEAYKEMLAKGLELGFDLPSIDAVMRKVPKE